jgi:hypothetical protein
MESAITFNAFRVLSLTADAAMKDVYRQQQRLQNALELGDCEALLSFKFLPSLPPGTEMLLEAVHRLERDRALEEIFWVHDLDGKMDLRFKDSNSVLRTLREDATLNTSRGAVAQHNLAVVLMFLALDPSDERSFEYWHESLTLWTKSLTNRIFWQFIEDRAETGSLIAQPSNVPRLQSQAQRMIRQLVNDQLWAAIGDNNYKATARFSQLAVSHAALLESDATLVEIANRLIKDGSAELGAVIDRISEAKDHPDPPARRAILATAEADILKIYDKTANILHVLQVNAACARWSDSKAIALGQLSVEYFNCLDDKTESLRLVADARQSAQQEETRERLDGDWQYLQRALLCSEAMKLITSGDFALAEQKLAGALSISTEEQKEEVTRLQEACHRSRVFWGVDSSKRSPGLQTVNGVGATFYGKRGYDASTNTYVTNHWFVFLFIPIIPIASYRVSAASAGSYYIHGRVPLSSALRKWRWGVLAATVLLIICANVDWGTNSSSSPPVSSSYSSPAPDLTSPATSIAPVPTQSYSQPPAFDSRGSYSEIAEGSGIETERTELRGLKDSLDIRKQQIDEEAKALNQMESNMQSVKTSYTSDTVPEEIRTQFNATLEDYQRRVPQYNESIESFNADGQNYQRRVDAFNARVNRYNAKR